MLNIIEKIGNTTNKFQSKTNALATQYQQQAVFRQGNIMSPTLFNIMIDSVI
jgi:hypothetical protein